MTTLEAPPSRIETKPVLTAPPKAQAILRQITDDQICILTFDRPNSAANIFDKAALQELDRHLDFVTGNEQLRGLILASAKPAIFVAGADIKSFANHAGTPELHDLIELGQSVFNRISILRIPTVAAIHGAALGGGFEVCLACSYRVASDDKATKIGLPEIQLGILPAWGGSTRLPRLIGLPKALDIILAGKTVAAKQALKRGMVDSVVPVEYLLENSIQMLRRGKARRAGHGLMNNALVGSVLRKKLRSD